MTIKVTLDKSENSNIILIINCNTQPINLNPQYTDTYAIKNIQYMPDKNKINDIFTEACENNISQLIFLDKSEQLFSNKALFNLIQHNLEREWHNFHNFTFVSINGRVNLHRYADGRVLIQELEKIPKIIFKPRI